MNVRVILVQLVIVGALFLALEYTDKQRIEDFATGESRDYVLRRLDVTQVARIVVEKGASKLELGKKPRGEDGKDAWAATSAFDYPVSTKKVDALLDRLKTLRRAKERGDNQEFFGRFGLDGAARTVVRLLDGKKTLLARAIFGRVQGDVTFMLDPDKEEAFEADGKHEISTDRTQWLDLGVGHEVNQADLEFILIENSHKERFGLGKAVKEEKPAKGAKKAGKPEAKWHLLSADPFGRLHVGAEADKWRVEDLLDKLKKLRASDVAPPMRFSRRRRRGGPQASQLKRYGMLPPRLRVVVRYAGGRQVMFNLSWVEEKGVKTYYFYDQSRTLLDFGGATFTLDTSQATLVRVYQVKESDFKDFDAKQEEYFTWEYKEKLRKEKEEKEKKEKAKQKDEGKEKEKGPKKDEAKEAKKREKKKGPGRKAGAPEVKRGEAKKPPKKEDSHHGHSHGKRE